MKAIYIKHATEGDSLTHYGVKGMKWHKHKAKYIDDQYLKELEANGGNASNYSNKKNTKTGATKGGSEYQRELAYNSKKNPKSPTYSSISSKKVPWYKAKAPWYGKQKQVASSVKKFGTKKLRSAKRSVSKGLSWFKKNAISSRTKTKSYTSFGTVKRENKTIQRPSTFGIKRR